MNLFCSVSWTSWYNTRRIPESLSFLYLDYYGTFWTKGLLFSNDLLVNLLAIDLVIITADIFKNFYYACAINELYSI